MGQSQPEAIVAQLLDVVGVLAQAATRDARRLVTARTVDDILPIEGADAIELAVVGGWKVVVKKGDFKIGDPAIYFEIDSFLPDGVEAWQFLVDKSPKMFEGKKGHKLRTIKLRGQISQGLILPLASLPLVAAVCKNDPMPDGLSEDVQAAYKDLAYGMHEYEAALDARDMDFSGLLGVVKWEATLHASLAGQAEGLFPSFIRKTDQERCQNIVDEIFGYEDTVIPAAGERPEIIRPARATRDRFYEVTMKMDGSSGTFFVRQRYSEPVLDSDGALIAPELGVCSRNLQLKISDANKDNTFVRVLFDTGLNIALENFHLNTGRSIAVQGEVMGPNIQGNRENLTKVTLFVYDIYDIDKREYVTQADRFAILRELKLLAPTLRHVPIYVLGGKPGSKASFVEFDNIAYEDFVCHTLEHLGLTSIDELLKFAEGPSLVHPIREGVVFKADDGTFSFKAISNTYLAKEKD